jgi:hypothetical protein
LIARWISKPNGIAEPISWNIGRLEGWISKPKRIAEPLVGKVEWWKDGKSACRFRGGSIPPAYHHNVIGVIGRMDGGKWKVEM